EPFDKAGAYAVQDPAFDPADVVEGCFLTVVGLPLCALAQLLVTTGALPNDPRSVCQRALVAGCSLPVPASDQILATSNQL
ncbi:MAG: Maf family protein, partial [Chloroflexi bacterium]|nr:Maf family protein [Chloroflexota bacterium]